MGGFNYWAFFLLGVDSLIACIVTGPMFIKQRPHEHSEHRSPDEREHTSQWKWWAIGGVSALALPYGLSYGAGDGIGFLIGTLFHYSVSDSISSAIETTLLFFELEWAALPEERAEELLADPGLDFCRHHLRNVRRYREHLLSCASCRDFSLDRCEIKASSSVATSCARSASLIIKCSNFRSASL